MFVILFYFIKEHNTIYHIVKFDYILIGPFSANCRRDITFNDDKSTRIDWKKN